MVSELLCEQAGGQGLRQEWCAARHFLADGLQLLLHGGIGHLVSGTVPVVPQLVAEGQ